MKNNMRVQIIPTPTQEDYRNRLRVMYKENYKVFRSEELRKFLFEYFVFLEESVTGETGTKYSVDDYDIAGLENLIGEMESLLINVNNSKLKANKILGISNLL